MSKSEISDRWGKIVQRCHPSVGESTYLAIWNAVFKICACNCFQKSVYVSKRCFDFSKLSSQIILLWSYFHICLKNNVVPFTSTNLSFHLTSIPSMSCSNVFKTTLNTISNFMFSKNQINWNVKQYCSSRYGSSYSTVQNMKK